LRPIAGLTKKVDAKEEGTMFQFGDFCIAMESVLDDAIVQAAPGRSVSRVDDFLPIRCLEEKKIRNYTQYNLLGHPGQGPPSPSGEVRYGKG
jgi:hypothetical protein